jgi:hypothetical protein
MVPEIDINGFNRSIVPYSALLKNVVNNGVRNREKNFDRAFNPPNTTESFSSNLNLLKVFNDFK